MACSRRRPTQFVKNGQDGFARLCKLHRLNVAAAIHCIESCSQTIQEGPMSASCWGGGHD